MNKLFTNLLLTLGFTVLFSGVAFSVDEYVYKAEFQKAWQLYSNSFSNEKTPETYYDMCKITYYFNDFKTASMYCRNATTELNNSEKNDDVLKAKIAFLQGDIYLANSDNKDVILENYSVAENLKLGNDFEDKFETARLYTNIGRTRYKFGEKDFAFNDYFKKALEIADTSEDKKFNLIRAQIYFIYAEDYKSLNEKSKEKEYLEKALNELDTAGDYKDILLKAQIYKNLAIWYESVKRDKKKAIEYYKKSAVETESFPYVATFKNKMALSSLQLKEIDEMNEEFPYDIDVNIEEGFRYLNDTEKAEKYFTRAEKINPSSGYTPLAIAGVYSEAYMKTGNKLYPFKINEYLKVAEEKAKYSPKIYKSAALIKLLTKSGKSANLYYNKYIEYSDDKAVAHCKAASDYWEFYNGKEGLKKIISHIESALKIDPDIDDIYIRMLISAYLKSGNEKKAQSIKNKYL